MTEGSFYFSSKIQLMSLREQIQEDIITYASALDDGSDGGCLTDDILDQLCDIVVSNFNKLLNK
jgi:hypothetical protein